MALKNPVGRQMRYGSKTFTVIGILDNIVIQSPYQPVDPLMIYLAIRRFNYWAECFPLFTLRHEPAPVYEQAWAAMGSIIQAIVPKPHPVATGPRMAVPKGRVR